MFSIYIKQQPAHTGLTLTQAARFWHEQGYGKQAPRPAVWYNEPGISPAAIDTNQPPFATPLNDIEPLKDEDRMLFLNMIKGQYDNFILQPGIFANAQTNFITIVMPKDPTTDPSEIDENTEIRFSPIFVQLTPAIGHLVQSIAGASMKSVEQSVDVPMKRNQAPGSQPQEPTASSVPISTGTVADLAKFRKDQKKNG